jgi:ParB-like nuclease domain
MSTKLFNWRTHLPVHPAADLFPLMSEAELKELAEDIKKNGLLEQPVFYRDRELGLCVLDGRNRLDACELFGRQTVDSGGLPKVGVIRDPSRSFDPLTFVLSKNVHRRHLTAEQRRELIAKVLKAKPDASDRSIAKQVKADHKTVAGVRREAEGRGEIPHVETRTDSKGRAQPATKPKSARQESIEENTEEAENNGGFMLAVIGGAAKAASIAARNLHHPLTQDERSAAVAAIDRVMENWRRIKGKVRSGELGGDADIKSFETHVLELLQLTKGQNPQRFAKTTVAQPLLGDLAHFLRELVTVRKLVAETSGDDADTSAEKRKADYAASEAAP